MSPEMQARLEHVFNTINAKRDEEKKAKQTLSKEKKDKLYGNLGVAIIRNESGKLGAILPVGMSATKLGSVVVKCQDKIEEFKTSNDQILKL